MKRVGFPVKLTAAEKEHLKQAADRVQHSLGSYIRAAALMKANEDLGIAIKPPRPVKAHKKPAADERQLEITDGDRK